MRTQEKLIYTNERGESIEFSPASSYLSLIHIYVSAVSIPANADTDISARSYFDGVIEREQQERLERRKKLLKIQLLTEV